MGGQELPVALVANKVEQKGLLYAQVYVSVMGQRVYEFVVDQKNESNYDLVLRSVGQDLITGTIKSTDKKLENDWNSYASGYLDYSLFIHNIIKSVKGLASV